MICSDILRIDATPPVTKPGPRWSAWRRFPMCVVSYAALGLHDRAAERSRPGGPNSRAQATPLEVSWLTQSCAATSQATRFRRRRRVALSGTTRTSRSPLDMSVHGGEAVMPTSRMKRRERRNPAVESSAVWSGANTSGASPIAGVFWRLELEQLRARIAGLMGR
jgi:hypothetical protein